MKIIILSFVAALLITLLFSPLIIPLLKRFKFGQNIRSDGPSSHLKKSGTPTMGGIIFLIGTSVPVLALAWREHEALFVLLVTWLFAAVGMLDDSKKIIKHQSEGLTPKQKMLGLIFASSVLIAGALLIFDKGTGMIIPFSGFFVQGGIVWQLPVPVFVLAALFVALGSANAVNLTDGLDGLAIGISFMVALSFLFMTNVAGLTGLSLYLAALAGGCLGFLFFNRFPAKVFMGDMGSLALGGAFAAISVMSGTELFLVILGAVFVIETLSDIIQVTVFKITKKKTGEGKRVFKMAPLHHHFEKCGWSEVKVVTVFWICTFICCLIGMIGFYNM